MDLTQEVQEKLAARFDTQKVGWKAQAVKGDRALAVAYVDARTVAERLDEVAPGWTFNWEPVASAKGCTAKGTLTVAAATRSDVGQGDDWKGAVSDALKRCAVQFGVARYLYRLQKQWVDYDREHKRLAEEPRLHWLEDELTRKRFWSWAKGELGLTKEQIHEALGVASVYEFKGTKEDAKQLLKEAA